MLRITQTQTGDDVTIRLEGSLLGAWVDEAGAAISAVEAAGQRSLDLADLRFADSRGVQLLVDLRRRGFQVISSSCFVAQLLTMESK